MKIKTFPIVAIGTCLLACSAPSSRAVVVMLSDNPDAGPFLADFLNEEFSNVTEIRRGNFANFSNAATQDALTGNGAYAGMGGADLVIIGRTISSTNYENGAAAGFNTLSIPVISFTSYASRAAGNRLGWHTLSATTNILTGGNETLISAAGAAVYGGAAGEMRDFFEGNSENTFNGLPEPLATYGGGTVLASIGGAAQSVSWETGSAPADPAAATVATFPGPRYLFNLDNDPSPSDPERADLNSLTPTGRAALVNGLSNYGLVAVPEPTVSLTLFAGLGFLAFRRKR